MELKERMQREVPHGYEEQQSGGLYLDNFELATSIHALNIESIKLPTPIPQVEDASFDVKNPEELMPLGDL